MAGENLLFFAGTFIKAGSAIQQGRIADIEARAEAALNERNARIAEMDAKAREAKARFDAVRVSRRGTDILGRLRVRLGASGARLDVGAPIRVLSEQAEELELEQLLVGFEGRTEAARFRSIAGIERFKGSLAKARGKSARREGLTRAGTSLLTDFATAKQEGFL